MYWMIWRIVGSHLTGSWQKSSSTGNTGHRFYSSETPCPFDFGTNWFGLRLALRTYAGTTYHPLYHPQCVGDGPFFLVVSLHSLASHRPPRKRMFQPPIQLRGPVTAFSVVWQHLLLRARSLVPDKPLSFLQRLQSFSNRKNCVCVVLCRPPYLVESGHIAHAVMDVQSIRLPNVRVVVSQNTFRLKDYFPNSHCQMTPSTGRLSTPASIFGLGRTHTLDFPRILPSRASDSACRCHREALLHSPPCVFPTN